MKNLFIIIIFILFFPLTCLATQPKISNLACSPSNPSVGDSVTISFDLDVGGSRSEGTINFGDDAIPFAFDFVQCNSNCSLSYTHTYSTKGTKSVQVAVRNISTRESTSANLSINVSESITGVGSGTGSNKRGPLDNPINARNFPELLGWFSRVLFWFSVIFLPLGIIAGGFLYLTSTANPDKITLAKKVILYCVVLSGTTMIIHWMIMLLAGEITFTSLLWLKKLLV